MKKALILITLLLACDFRLLDDQTAALVNKEPISLEEVRNNIHFMTLYARNLKGRELVDAHLDLLIEKKLFAQEGRRLGFEQTPLVRQVTDWAERDQMIKALYRDEVYNKARPTEEEVRAAFFRGREQVQVRHLFARSEVDALRLKEELDRGVPFAALAARTFRDSTLARSGGDLGFVGYDDIDEKLAEVAFALPKGEISPPVRSRYGWHILRVENRRQHIFNSEAEYGQKREAVAADLTRAMQKKMAGAYVDRMMSAQDVRMINATFNTIASRVRETVLNAGRMITDYQPMLGGTELLQVNDGVSGHGKEVLVIWKGGQMTLGDFMKRVESLPVSERPRIDTPGHLRFDIGKLVMRELLLKEATTTESRQGSDGAGGGAQMAGRVPFRHPLAARAGHDCSKQRRGGGLFRRAPGPLSRISAAPAPGRAPARLARRCTRSAEPGARGAFRRKDGPGL